MRCRKLLRGTQFCQAYLSLGEVAKGCRSPGFEKAGHAKVGRLRSAFCKRECYARIVCARTKIGLNAPRQAGLCAFQQMAYRVVMPFLPAPSPKCGDAPLVFEGTPAISRRRKFSRIRFLKGADSVA